MEMLMQYVWQHRLWPPPGRMTTVDGREVRIVHPGHLNRDSGPDFGDASIVIDGQPWVGNVEMHVHARDWHAHGHDNDPAYDSVILHVVMYDDCDVHRRSGEVIPQVVMTPSPDFLQHAARMMERSDQLPCMQHVRSLDSIYRSEWVEALTVERLNDKASRIEQYMADTQGDWYETTYRLLARSLGFGVNADAMERLAASMPLRYLLKHRDNLSLLEAMLLGQAGLLDNAAGADPYVQRLQADYAFMRTKFGLVPSSNIGWKMARMRPQNFPHRRIALLAALVHHDVVARCHPTMIETPDDARALLSVRMNEYWSRHYHLSDTATSSAITQVSRTTIDAVIVNVLVPLMYAYGLMHDNEHMRLRALAIQRALPAEVNSVVRRFADMGLECRDAGQSQAYIQLYRNYCQTHKCIYCRWGHRMLSQKVASR